MLNDKEREAAEIKAFEDLCSRLSERYPDYLIITRRSAGGFMIKSSDHCWALGAAHRFMNRVDNKDFQEVVEDLDGDR